MRHKFLFFLACSLNLFCVCLHAEIQKVIVKWNAALCLNACIPTLENNLRSVPAITDFQINPNAGVAELHWLPRFPFSYQVLNTAIKSVGIRINEIRVRVTGTVVHDAENFYVVSLGDNSRFQLIGPISPNQDRYIVRQNITSHPLAPQVQQKLMEVETSDQTITVEGPLFEPHRYTLQLVTEQVNFPPPPAQSFNQQQLGR